MAEPKLKTNEHMRRIARRIRDRQWKMLELAAQYGTIWFCAWNKARLPEGPDEIRCGLIDGMELLHWFQQVHPDWLKIGGWSEGRYAHRVTITDAGRAALKNREVYDMEPVEGGLVEPGWQAIPQEQERDG